MNEHVEATKRCQANDLQVEAAVNKHQTRSFLLPFNREERKQVQSNVLAELAMTLDARLQIIEESCNHVLITGKNLFKTATQSIFCPGVSLTETAYG